MLIVFDQDVRYGSKVFKKNQEYDVHPNFANRMLHKRAAHAKDETVKVLREKAVAKGVDKPYKLNKSELQEAVYGNNDA